MSALSEVCVEYKRTHRWWSRCWCSRRSFLTTRELREVPLDADRRSSSTSANSTSTNKCDCPSRTLTLEHKYIKRILFSSLIIYVNARNKVWFGAKCFVPTRSFPTLTKPSTWATLPFGRTSSKSGSLQKNKINATDCDRTCKIRHPWARKKTNRFFCFKLSSLILNPKQLVSQPVNK